MKLMASSLYPGIRTAVTTQSVKFFFANSIAACVMSACMGSVHAGLFDDEEARKAILDLRQRNESLRLSVEDAGKHVTEDVRRLTEENTQMRRSMLDLQNQIEMLKQDQAKLRGQDEQITRDLAEIQRRQKDLAGGVEERLRKVEPVKVTIDGRDFMVEPTEKRDYESALAVFRKGEFMPSQTAFFDFIRRNPQSGYIPSALFWLANAQYAMREYKEAIINFRSLVVQFSDHSRAPEALLSVANCQAELKDLRATRKTLEELVKNYPLSEAAVAAKERITRLR